jgi:hypothetical protein
MSANDTRDNSCGACGACDWIGVEYGYPCPERYDGVSEWKCRACGARWGRWTRKLLKDGELEKRYGGE